MIDDEGIRVWRINYGLDKRSPEDAGRWWHERNNGMAPAVAVAALGLCIEEIERLRALCRARPRISQRIAPELPLSLLRWIDQIDAAGRGEGEK